MERGKSKKKGEGKIRTHCQDTSCNRRRKSKDRGFEAGEQYLAHFYQKKKRVRKGNMEKFEGERLYSKSYEKKAESG